ncbi:MAG: PhoH family protein [Leptospiraceae bacterium]|nr:PhoH family protein [Leptospiraceae bacterium]MDW7976162.1 PhoH family protein [Leptospiraceae bacterium]
MEYIILDTNVLLLDPNAYLKFPKKHVIIPLVVIEELDSFKRDVTTIGKAAREIIRAIDKLRVSGKLTEGVKLPNESVLQVYILNDFEELPEGLNKILKDNYLLSTGLKLKKIYKKNVKIITKDADLRIKSDVLGIQAEDYNTTEDIGSLEKLYTGERTIYTTDEWIERFYKNEPLFWQEDKIEFSFEPLHEPILVNEYITLKSENKSALARAHKSGRLIPLKEEKVFNIHPKNKEQRFAFDALLDPEIQLVTIAGRAGTGKTLIALACGLQQVMEKEIYKKLLVARPVVPLGKDIGFLPGEVEEKIRPWMQPIYDNLEFLLENGSYAYKEEEFEKKSHKHKDVFATIDYLKETGVIDVEPLTFIRGRSIPKQFVIIDEAQNLSPHEAKTIITRAGIGTKIVFTGDYYQIDHPYLNLYTNGISYTFSKLKGQPIFAHVTLEKGERSPLAELASKLMEI